MIQPFRTARQALLAVVVASLGFMSAALAGPATPFTQEAFNAAQAAGSPILIEVAADWCPTCKAQAPILEKLAASPKFKDVKMFRVDFDAQKAVVKQLGARSQSTLIVFKGKTERGRSVGDTQAAAIESLLAKSL